ncbi:hypothetical protein [Parapedobacter defluvii]|uniref:hypothetical protein n=1 Tax=Parapedobacter defluvii TaxID=2045106 RepID=UPI0033424CD4
MLLERLALFLTETEGFRYFEGESCLEIWLSDREELPLVVSAIRRERYIISTAGLCYETKDEERAYRYILRIFLDMKTSSTDKKRISSI